MGCWHRVVLYIYYIYIHRACISSICLLPKPAYKSTHKSTDQSRMEFPELSVTVNQSETEFDDVIISDWPSVIIWLLIGRRHFKPLCRIYIIYIYIYTVFIYGYIAYIYADKSNFSKTRKDFTIIINNAFFYKYDSVYFCLIYSYSIGIS